MLGCSCGSIIYSCGIPSLSPHVFVLYLSVHAAAGRMYTKTADKIRRSIYIIYASILLLATTGDGRRLAKLACMARLLASLIARTSL